MLPVRQLITAEAEELFLKIRARDGNGGRHQFYSSDSPTLSLFLVLLMLIILYRTLNSVTDFFLGSFVVDIQLDFVPFP